MNSGNLEYWNKNNIATTVNNNPVYKTIYSTSPHDYKEPESAAYSGFSTSGLNTTTLNQFNIFGSYNKGWNFYCQPNFSGSLIFFSTLGYRDVRSSRVSSLTGGTLNECETCGPYWNAGPSTTATYARYFVFGSYYIYPQGDDKRAYGFAIRSVIE